MPLPSDYSLWNFPSDYSLFTNSLVVIPEKEIIKLTTKKIFPKAGYIILLAGPSDHRNRMTEEPKRKFRLNAKNLFLTWPKNDVDSGTVLNKIVETFGMDNVSYVCVSEEEHEDGSPHLHAVVCLKKPCDVRNVKTLDDIGGKHGNYQSARNVKDVYTYVRKGGKFVEHGTPPKICVEKISETVAQSLRNGGSLDSVEEMDPAYFMLHQRQIKEYAQFVEMKKRKTAPKPPPLFYNSWGYCFELGVPREFKQKQYWICGPPNTGKTSMIMSFLDTGFRGFIIPTNNDFAEWDDDGYDFAYIDEFKGSLTIQFLNEFLQGSPMMLNAKFGSRSKKKNIPVFIISNFEPQQVYQNVNQVSMQALLTRIQIIQTK